MSATFRLFVYGSLMNGLKYAQLMAGATHVGPAMTRETYTLRDLGPFPAASPGGASPLRGEVYLVDGPTLARIDVLEGHPELYARWERTLADGTTAWIYEVVSSNWDRAVLDVAPVVADGDWRAWLDRREPT